MTCSLLQLATLKFETKLPIYVRKSCFMAPLALGRKTKFSTVYPTIYLPNENFQYSYHLIICIKARPIILILQIHKTFYLCIQDSLLCVADFKRPLSSLHKSKKNVIHSMFFHNATSTCFFLFLLTDTQNIQCIDKL